MSRFSKLIFYATAIYVFFLSWGLLQERISTQTYIHSESLMHSKFNYFVFLNMVQAFVACLVSYLALWWNKRATAKNEKSVIEIPSKALSFELFKVGLSGSLASPFGYMSLKHINYPTMILGKSCKLVPVMLMGLLVYRRKYSLHQYLAVALITIGVSSFMLFEGNNGKKSTNSTSIVGILLLLINLLFDGYTNSTQDSIFSRFPQIQSQSMMFFMNLISGVLLAGYLLVLAPFGGELPHALGFLLGHPAALWDVLAFSLCGSLGQVFVFATIQSFGSLALVAISVTRKLFTILLSLFWFEHVLVWQQWVSVGLVFAALGIETMHSFRKEKSTKKIA